MIHTIDLHFFGHEKTIASFLIETSGGPVLIETGPHSTFERLKEQIGALGYRLEDIRHVFVTHIHLDHAGAAWALAETGSTIYVHPFGVKHLHDPSRLWGSAKRIYQDEMERLWGLMHPIPHERLSAVGHEDAITIGDTVVKAWHTPGHAVHHIAWQVGDVVFTGDVAGVRIDQSIVVPPCPPPDINLEDWQESIRLIRSLGPSVLYLTHFGAVRSIDAHFAELESRLWEWANWIRPHYEKGEDVQSIIPGFEAFVMDQLKEYGIGGEALLRYENANPSWMSVAGLMRYWEKKETTP